MATAAETTLANLDAAIANATARLAELDAVPVETRARSEVTAGGVTLSWNQYRDSLLRLIQGYKDARAGLVGAAWGAESVLSVVR